MPRLSLALFLALTSLAIACGGGGGGSPPPATYRISGTVSGVVATGVAVTLSGASSGTTTTDATGNYSFAGLANGAYTVTASLAGYAFNPANRSVTLSGADVGGQNFAATGAYGISGTVSGAIAAGVTVSLTGAATASATTDASGNYSFTGLANGAYTVTPSLAGYLFNPINVSVTVAGANVTGKNFNATAGTGYGISGTVSGLVAAGVTVSLTGAVTGSATTDASGNYTFTGLANGTYTVTPSLAGYVFTPANRSVTVSGANVTAQDFTDTGAYAISGTVTGVVVSGVTVSLTGAATASTATDASGNYTFAGLANGAYTVTPSLAGYTFTPPNRSVTVSGASVTGQDFSDTGTAYGISGTISGAPAAGVTVRLSGAATAIATTDAAGGYTFGGLANGATYTVTPSMAGYTFAPASTTATIALANATANFTATASGSPLVSFSGTVAYGGTKTGRVFVTVRWQNQGGDVAGGTSLAAPGSFTISGVQAPGSLPATAIVTAWRDVLGIDRCNGAADPFFTTTVPVAASTVSLGTLTLVDPAAATPAAPQLDGVAPGETAAAVIYGVPRDAQGYEAADSYKIYWSSTASPGPSNKLGVLTVPAGPGFGIVNGLTNGTSYYFGVSALAGTNESPVSASPVSVAIGPPAGATAIDGTVTFPALPAGTNTLYVVAQSALGPVLVARYVNPTSPQSYSIPAPDGTYELFAFIDVGNDGIVRATEPGLFGSRVNPTVTVSGASVTGPTLAIPTGNARASVATSHQVYGGGTMDSLEFEVSSNLKLPVKVQVTGGPNVLPPMDVGVSGNDNVNARFRFTWNLNPTVPVVGDVYSLSVTYSDGTTEVLPVSVSAYYTATPTPTSPVSGATGVGTTPTFTWTAPSPAPAGAYNYDIMVYPAGGGNGWYYGPMPSSQTSVPYNVNGNGPPLVVSTPYQWQIEVMDANGNRASSQSTFTP